MARKGPLTASFVRTVTTPGRFGDGRGSYGLYLRVYRRADGRIAKSWGQRIAINGRRTNLGLGTYPLATLAKARAKALENAREVAEGRDPRGGGIPSFEAATEAVIRLRRPTWKPGGRSEQQWRSAFEVHVFPRIGSKPVNAVTSGDVLALLTADDLWNRRRATARRLLQWLGLVFKRAIAEGHRPDNPVDAIKAALPSNGQRVQHQRAIHHSEVADALRKVRTSTSRPATRLCLEFLVLTAGRSKEVREATWDEIDGTTWTIPAERMKAGREHRVPLSAPALRVLGEAKKHSKRSTGLIFRGTQTGRPIDGKTLSDLLRQLAISGTPHGMRTAFRTWAGETGVSREVAESALAHVVKNQAEAAYARSDLLERRREVMRAWGRYCRPVSA